MVGDANFSLADCGVAYVTTGSGVFYDHITRRRASLRFSNRMQPRLAILAPNRG